MAEFFPSIILDNVLKQLERPIFQSNKLNCLQRIQVRDLRSKLGLIRCVIEDAEPLAVLFPDVVGKWVRDLQHVLYEIDDLLDEVLTRSMPSSGLLEKVGLRLYILPLDLTVSPKLKSFNKRLESIVKECYNCNLLVKPAPSSCSNTINGGVENPVARKGILRYHPDYMKDGGEFHMIGREDDKKKVIDLLFRENVLSPVVWISGEAGVGKTTLCHAIYNDEEVRNNFDCVRWVDFEDVNDSIEQQDQLKHEIESSIEKKDKTLLVWDSFPPYRFMYLQPEYWSEVRDLITKSHEGSKMLVNSLLSPEFWHTDAKYPHVLENDLCEEHCWSIFEKAAFAVGHDREEWMTILGKEIAKKCPGNPALLRAVGTLLYQNDDKAALWDYFACDFDFDRQYHHYCEISRVSQLLPKGQQLAGYLTLFTEYKLQLDTLFAQYAAHGFFTNLPATMQKRLTDEFLLWEIGEDEWVVASDFYTVRKKEDIITRLAGSEAVFLGLRTEIGVGKEVRHVAIDRPSSSAARHQDIIQLPRSLTNDAVHMRTLLFLKDLSPVKMSVETLDMLTSKLVRLRVLDLHDLALKALPSSFGKLIHLRYLDLSRNDFKELPKSICRLKNLRTLKLTYCDKLVKLPQSIKSLRLLKRLELGMCLDLTGMPSAIAEMTSLERLDRYVVDPHNGGLRYLKNLNSLESLSIELPRRWKKSSEEAEQANLKSKNRLTRVRFKWSGAYNAGDRNDHYDVLDKLEPCTKIRFLFIINFGGKAFPNWVTSLGIENLLTHISIKHCKGCRILPPFHKMPNLLSLTLTSMDIEYLQDDNNNRCDAVFFPSLIEIEIGRMRKLRGWSRDMSSLSLRFSDIDFVKIWDCPRLTVMPPFSDIDIDMILQDISKKMLQGIDWKESEGLEIVSIPDLVSLSDKFVTKLPKHLEVKDCDKWEVFWTNETERTPLTWKSLSEGFQRLENLRITNCPAMKYLSSSLKHLINLVKLEISGCSEDLDCLYDEDEDGMPWKALQRLERLKIGGFDKLETLPKALLQHIPPLRKLAIMDCKSLKSCFHFSELNEAKVCPNEEMGEPKMLSGVFRSLERLFIVNCPEIKYLSASLEQLVMLERLVISKCSEELDCLYKENDDGMPWKALQGLQMLKIEGFENLAALPKGLQHLDQLFMLAIKDCKNLKGGLDSLPRLKELYIQSCPHFSKEHTRTDVKVFEEEANFGEIRRPLRSGW